MSWQESDKIVDQMIKGSNGTLWGFKLEESSHYPILQKLLEISGNKGLLVDIGCGAGDVSRIWGADYLGIDLDWVIQRVSKQCNPDKSFLSLDLTTQLNFQDIPESNCVLMNAFLDVQENPIEILEKICKEANTNWIIVHRQRIQDIEKGKFEYVAGYGDSLVPASTMSFNELNFIKENYSKEFLIGHWENYCYSFAMRIR
jgi:hypothetical protein